MTWGAVLLASLAYRRALPVLVPAVAGMVFLASAYARVDLAADPQAALALVFIPMYALVPIGLGALLGLGWDQALARRSAAGSNRAP